MRRKGGESVTGLRHRPIDSNGGTKTDKKQKARTKQLETQGVNNGNKVTSLTDIVRLRAKIPWQHNTVELKVQLHYTAGPFL